MDYESQLAPETFATFLETLSHEINVARKEIQKAPAGPARAQKLQQLVDDEIAQGSQIEVSCKKGCSACCHMEVEITNYEAEILNSLVSDGHPIDRNRLQQQSTRNVQDPIWKEGIRNATNRCVFLDKDGACGIYENRPVMCRRHSVTSPPENCATLDKTIVIRYFPKVDLLVSAANEDSQIEVGPLAKMLELKLSLK